MKKKLCLLLCFCMLGLSGCSTMKKYTKTFYDSFDTVTTYITYCDSEDKFKEQCALIEERLEYYDHLFDRYKSYSAINNVNKINELAGKEPVKVDQPLIDLIELSIERNKTISSNVNIAFGRVIDVWHKYREEAENNGGVGDVPTTKELNEAAKHTDINSIIVDKEKSTVYINDKEVSMDLGATAKGYAIELIKQELIKEGVDNFLLSGGGNVASYGERKIENEGTFYLDECKDHYCVGIQSPMDGNFSKTDEESENEAILVVDGESIVTSGDYQRFYKDINGVRYHHLIDPSTLYPGIYFRSVSIITEDSGLADFLSSAIFLMDYDKGKELIDSLEDVEAIWLLEDGKVRYSSGLKDGYEFYVLDKERLK